MVRVASRMERYYKKEAQGSSRTKRNTRLYNSIYSYGKYSNIEGIASIDNTNQIDITKVKQMLDNREKYQAERKYRRLTNEENEVQELPKVRSRYKEEEDRTYDIMDVLTKAREKKEPDDKERVLSKTSYDVLKNLDLKRNATRKDYYDNDDDLKDMIQTITNTSMLNKLDDADLAADMFSDLKGHNEDTQVGNLNNIKELIEENKKNEKEKEKEQTMDNSFFTSNLKLKKKDFVGYEEEEKKGSVFKTIFVTILILGIIAVVGILVVQRLGLF